MTSDAKVMRQFDYINEKDCFPQISISGGVCYFLWNKKFEGDCTVVNVANGKRNSLVRPMDEFQVFVRYNDAVSILHKILNHAGFEALDTVISPLMPFGLPTNYRGEKEKSKAKPLRLYASDTVTYIGRSEIEKGNELVDSYKVMMSKMSAEHAGEPNKEGMFNVFTKTMRILKPGEVCTHSYFLLGNYDNEIEANGLLTYLKTRFVRFIVMTTLSAVNLSKLVFFNVPMQDFTKSWTDDELYAEYNLNSEEISFIESMINPMQ